MALLGGIVLLMMMAMTIVDVIGRYAFNSPLRGTGELTELLLVSVIFMGLPAVTLENGHVTVDVLTEHLPKWSERFRNLAIGIINTVILCLIGWQIWIHAGQIGAYGDVTTTLRLPIAPIGYFCAACTFASAIASLTAAFMPPSNSPIKG
ncbi:TRAP-type C4-dicarboxylate transport system permease small subunit [Agrobacterium vitis]|nr:TRAP-type C4-dicarboxylate transport system permease small subunit [Agrobacterium vitis]